MTELCDYEKCVLRVLNGERGMSISWGAAQSEAVKSLHGMGYLTGPPGYKLTEKGREKAKELTSAAWRPREFKP